MDQAEINFRNRVFEERKIEKLMKCVECGSTDNVKNVMIDKTNRCFDCEIKMTRAYNYLEKHSKVFNNLSMDEQGRISTELGRMMINAGTGR